MKNQEIKKGQKVGLQKNSEYKIGTVLEIKNYKALVQFQYSKRWCNIANLDEVI